MKALMYIFLFNSALTGYSFSQEQISQLKYLSYYSDVIVTGKVVYKKSEWVNNKTKIITKVTVAADEFLKGSSGSEIIVTCPGGEIDNIGELYTHMPSFSLDEEVLLFLQKEKDSFSFIVSGGEAGKISLTSIPGTNDKNSGGAVKLSALKKEIRNILENGY